MHDTAPTASRPRRWPHFSSTLRSTALTARLGRVLGICFTICFVTGLLSHYQYSPWTWLPEPAAPVWLYRVTQGLHVTTGTASIPLLLVKLWSVYPNLFRWPPVRSMVQALERLSVFVLVSTSLVQLFTGYFNVLNWYPWHWDFRAVHYRLAFIVIGSVVLHIAVKLPDIKYGLRAKLPQADVLTEVQWADNPVSHSNAGEQPAPKTPALTRRGLLVTTGAGVGLVVVTSVGQTITPLRGVGLLAVRDSRDGPQGVPINRTAEQAGIVTADTSSAWTLSVVGPKPFELTLAEVESLARAEADLPISCVEGWSVGAHWRGIKLVDLVERAGGSSDSRVRLVSLEKKGSYRESYVDGPQVSHALLATHLNGARLDLNHGYPLRLISPNRPGVLNTKWLSRVEIV